MTNTKYKKREEKMHHHTIQGGWVVFAIMLLAFGCNDPGAGDTNKNESPWQGDESGVEDETGLTFPGLNLGSDDCSANCDGITCGPDGCGGSCGICDNGGSCALGSCTTIGSEVGDEGGGTGEGGSNSSCVTNCTNKECGEDGCGGLCGQCSNGVCNEDMGICDDEETGPVTLPECAPGTTCLFPPDSPTNTQVSVVAGVPAQLNGGAYPSGVFSLTSIALYPDTLTQGDPFPFEILMNDGGGTKGSAVFFPPHFGLSADLNIYAAIPQLSEDGNIEASVHGGGCTEAFQQILYVDVLECYEDDEPEFTIPEAFPYEYDGDTLLLVLVIPPETLFGLLDEEYAELASTIFEADLQILFEFSKTSEL